MTFRPLHDRIVVRRIENDNITAGGILIPDNAQEKPAQGIVEAIGPGARNDAGDRVPMSVAVGDKVLFGKYSGTEVKLAGDDLLIIRDGDILGVVDPSS